MPTEPWRVAADANGSPARSSLGLLDHVVVEAPRARVELAAKGLRLAAAAKVCFGRTAARVVFLLSPGGLNWGSVLAHRLYPCYQPIFRCGL
jgi:hypothetical protein